MKKYTAIGHWKGNSNMAHVTLEQNTKADFARDLTRNEFVAYVILTEKAIEKLAAAETSYDRFSMVCKMTGNYRKWQIITDYIEQVILN